jgi:soluble lytic murein transglycosylase-like protein
VRAAGIARGGLRLEYRDPLTANAPEPTPEPIDVRAIVIASARRHGVDVEQFVRVAWCESRFDPNAVNPASDARGVLQFIPTTWAANSVRYGWPGASPHDPYAASDVAAAMFARGQSHQWECR